MQRDFVYLSIIAVLAYLAFSNNLATKSSSSTTSHSDSSPTHLRVLEPEAAVTSEHQAITAKTPSIIEEDYDDEDPKAPPSSAYFWICLGISILLILFGGTMSGLTVGYLSIDELQLELKMKNGTEEEKKDASIIIPILAKHHLLLSTLLLANAFAMEALPLFLDAIMPAYAAIIVSTSAVVVFGEIVPQAYCTGPNQIKIARKMAPLIKCLMYALFIICYPISVILDKVLGTHHKTRFVKKDLKALIQLHEGSVEGSPTKHELEGSLEEDEEAQLTVDEVRVINSTIDLRDTPVTKEMETIERVFMVSYGEKIDKDTLRKISRAGYSKVPVYINGDRNQVIGFIRVKTLLEFDKYDGKSLEEAEAHLKRPLIVAKDTSMLEMMMLFQEQRTGVALVSDDTIKDKDKDATAFTYSRDLLAQERVSVSLIGLISLKDIFEEILESKMMDDDVHQYPQQPLNIPLLKPPNTKVNKKIDEIVSPRSLSPSPRKNEGFQSPRIQLAEAMMPEGDLTRRLLEP